MYLNLYQFSTSNYIIHKYFTYNYHEDFLLNNYKMCVYLNIYNYINTIYY